MTGGRVGPKTSGANPVVVKPAEGGRRCPAAVKPLALTGRLAASTRGERGRGEDEETP